MLAAQIVRHIGYGMLGNGPVLKRRLRAMQRSGVSTILNLHRVGEPDGSAYRPLSPVLFDELLGWLKRHFTLTTLAALAEPAPRPKMVLSFDDGYRDFAEVAMPILARHGVRANQNIIPRCVETGLPPINVLAADFLGKAPAERVAALTLPGFDFRDRRRLWPRLDDFLKKRAHAEQMELEKLLLPQFFAWKRFEPTPMMNAAELCEAAHVYEVGCHSFSHASMEYESDDYLRDDLARCRTWFETTLGLPMTIYAFPNGSYRESHLEIARAAGLAHILLVGGDFSDGGPVHHRFGFEAGSGSEARFRALGARRRVPA